MKVTRREIVGLALATAVVAQMPPDEQLKQNADSLDRFELKQDTEPAFTFKV